ncbi:MAG: hypothetical protein P8Z37_18450, partial [Acidobacteriota bacterium]
MKKTPQNRFIRFLLENSIFLILGAAIGLIWANIDHESYEFITEEPPAAASGLFPPFQAVPVPVPMWGFGMPGWGWPGATWTPFW